MTNENQNLLVEELKKYNRDNRSQCLCKCPAPYCPKCHGINSDPGINGYLICLAEEDGIAALTDWDEDILCLLISYECSWPELIQTYKSIQSWD